jgi:hypothetical protein
MCDQTQGRDLSRRDVVRIGASVGAAGVLLSVLGACGSSTRRAAAQTSTIGGAPVIDEGLFTPSRPGPITTKPGVASGSLSETPSFVIPRAQWTSAGVRAWLADPMTTPRAITVHHDAISPRPSGSYTASVRRLNAIRNGHLSNSWADIGYHYAIDPSGRVWQGRPLTYQGAHVKDQNPGNIGVVLFGNHERVEPTTAALASLNRLIAHEMRRFGIPLSGIKTHRELAPTACPGRHLQVAMNQTRRPGGTLALAIESGFANV